MAGCAGCAQRRKVIAQVVSGNTTAKAGALKVAASLKSDAKRLVSRPLKSSFRVK